MLFLKAEHCVVLALTMVMLGGNAAAQPAVPVRDPTTIHPFEGEARDLIAVETCGLQRERDSRWVICAPRVHLFLTNGVTREHG